MPEVLTKQKCRRCDGELSYDEARGCSFCPICHPLKINKPAPPEEKKKYLDVKMTEAMVREIVRDELENWHIQKPSVTKEETEKPTLGEQYVQEILVEQKKNEELLELSAKAHKQSLDQRGITPNADGSYNAPKNWREQAKELGISLFQRKKADVLKDIKAKKAS